MIEELTQKIKFVLQCGNEAQAERIIEQFVFDQKEKTIAFSNFLFDNYVKFGEYFHLKGEFYWNTTRKTAEELLDVFNRSNEADA
jgi:hypothetical protein